MIMSREEEVWSHFAALALGGMMDPSSHNRPPMHTVVKVASEAADEMLVAFHKRFGKDESQSSGDTGGSGG